MYNPYIPVKNSNLPSLNYTRDAISHLNWVKDKVGEIQQKGKFMQAAKTYFLMIKNWFANWLNNSWAKFTPLQELQYLGEKLWQLK